MYRLLVSHESAFVDRLTYVSITPEVPEFSLEQWSPSPSPSPSRGHGAPAGRRAPRPGGARPRHH